MLVGVRIDSAAAGLLLFFGCENAEPMDLMISCHMGLAVPSFVTKEASKSPIRKNIGLKR